MPGTTTSPRGARRTTRSLTVRRTCVSVLTITALVAGCDALPAPSPSPGASSTLDALSPTTPLPVPTHYRLAGMVSDEGGPVARAEVSVDYADSPAPRGPAFWFPKWVKTRSDADGRFTVEFEATGATALLRAWHGDDQYEMEAQTVALASTDLTSHLRLRPVRTIRPGESATLSVARDSALCFDFDTLLSLTTRCDWVQVESGARQAPPVEFRAIENGSPGARVFTQERRPGLHAVAIEVPAAVDATQRYLLSVGLPVAK